MMIQVFAYHLESDFLNYYNHQIITEFNLKTLDLVMPILLQHKFPYLIFLITSFLNPFPH